MKESLLKAEPQWEEYSEEELKEHLKPTALDFKLRVAFWVEFEKFADPRHPNYAKKKISGPSVYRGVCNQKHWYERICTRPNRVFYITRPFTKADDANEANAKLAEMRISEFLNLSVWNADKTDWSSAKASFILNVAKEALNRRYGMSVERIAAIHKIQPGSPTVPSLTAEHIKDPLTIDERIAELQAAINPPKSEVVHDPGTIDVEIQDIEFEPESSE